MPIRRLRTWRPSSANRSLRLASLGQNPTRSLETYTPRRPRAAEGFFLRSEGRGAEGDREQRADKGFCRIHDTTGLLIPSPQSVSYAFPSGAFDRPVTLAMCWCCAMIPSYSPDLLAAAVELMCYFCTAIGVALAMFWAPK